jgi:hypothetical protein
VEGGKLGKLAFKSFEGHNTDKLNIRRREDFIQRAVIYRLPLKPLLLHGSWSSFM